MRGGMEGANAPSRQTHISEQLSRQNAEIGELEEAISQLETRIESVLGPSTPEQSSDSKVDSKIVPLASTIRDHNSRIINCSQRIHSLRARIEL